MEKRLFELMDKVFNKDGSVKHCGRNACIELIEYATKFDEEKKNEKTYYGNSRTGYMHIDNLLQLRAKVSNEMNQKLFELMQKVFYDDGTVKLCDKSDCQELIAYATKFDETRGVTPPEYGDSKTGYICVDRLINLWAEIRNG